MKGRVRRGHIAQNSLRSSSLNQSLALQEEEEEFRQPVVLAVTSLQTVCPVQPAAQLVVALPSPAPSPVPSHPPPLAPSPAPPPPTYQTPFPGSAFAGDFCRPPPIIFYGRSPILAKIF